MRKNKIFALSIWLSLATSGTLLSGFVLAGVNQWTSLGLDGATVSALSIDPISPATIYAGTQGFGIFKSINGGESWTAINDGLTNLAIRAVALDPSDSQMIYAGTEGSGVWIYKDYPEEVTDGDGGGASEKGDDGAFCYVHEN